MLRMVSGAAALAALMVALPAAAASKIECITSGYSAADMALFDNFVSQGMEKVEARTVVAPIKARADACAKAQGWSPDAVKNAIYYRMAGLSERSVIAHPELPADQMAKIDGTYSKNHARLRAILGPMIEGQLAGKAPELSNDNQIELGTMIITAGLPSDQASAVYIGKIFGARLMGEIVAEKFSKS